MPPGTEEWAEFSHKRGEQFKDFDEVRKEIVVQTEKIAGKKKNVSSVPIILKIFSPDVIDLSLVDLPGIIKVITNLLSSLILPFIRLQLRTCQKMLHRR